MNKDQEIIFLSKKLKALEQAKATLIFHTDESEFKQRLNKLLKQEVNETLTKIESILIR